jgi:outer membrane protein OmpA-like peptidoglycan-associated protein
VSAHSTHQTAPPQRADPQRATTQQSHGGARGAFTSINRLQRSVGNRAMGALLRSRVIQPKLEVSEPGDEFEREADRVADEVMRMPEPQSATTPLHAASSIGYSPSQETHHHPSVTLARAPVHISRMCAGCEADHEEREPESESQTEQKEEEKEEDDEKKFVQAEFAAPEPPEAPKNLESDLDNNHDGGTPLSEPQREFFEPRFGADLSGVRLHQDGQAAELAEQVNARAFTLGQDVYFGAGQYSPSTDEGQRLIAHELTHTLQQSGVEPVANQGSLAEPEQELDEREEEPEKQPVQAGERKVDEEGTQPLLSNTGLILPHYALSLVLPIMRMPLRPMIQRRANVSLAPAGLPCILMDVHGTPGELDIFFGHDNAGLSAANLALIENYVGLWVAKGLSPDLTIAGYASTDGSQRHNWRLSCQRAEAVQAELIRIGVPPDKTSIFAHGETNDFDTTNLEPNRRATIDSVPGTGPTITPTLTPHDNFAGRSLARFGLSEVIDVDYAATPGITAAEHFGVEWRLVTGTGTIVNLPGRPDTYTAGNVPATEQLGLVVSSGPALGTQLMLVNIPVIAPVTSYMQQVPGSGLCHTTGRASVGFRGNPFMLPADVSFTGIQWREGTGTTIATGSLSGLNGRVHTIGGWMSIGTGNVATGCMVNTVDSVSTSTTAVSFFGNWSGTQIWPIQWEYQAPGAAVMPLVVAVHLCIIDSAGNASISKALAGPFSRALADPTSCVAAGLLAAPHCC